MPTNPTRTSWLVRYAGGASLPGLFLAALIGTFGGSGVYVGHYGEGFSYLSNDPKACVNCHIMREQYDGWQKASHHAHATCNDCHAPVDFVGKYWTKAENGFWHSKGFTLQDFHEPIRIRAKNSVILQNNCIRCHQDLTSPLLAHGEALAEQISCVHCHDRVGHGPTR